MLEIRHGEADLDSLESGERHDLARGCLRNLNTIEPLIGEEPGHARLLRLLRAIEWQ